jgi:outer membrane protein
VRIAKNILSIVVLGLGVIASTTAIAELKLAFVDVDRAVASSEAAKELLTQLQGEFSTDEDTIKSIQTDAAALLQRLQKDGEVMSEDEKRRLQQEIESLNNDFVYQRQKLQKEVAARQGELFAGTEVKVRKAIEELVLENDYDMILPRAAALYVGELYDVTRKVTEKLNEMDKP